MNLKTQDREKFRKFLCNLDEAQVICVQAQLRQEKRNIDHLLDDVQLRLDYLGVFTLANITTLARNTERKDEKKV